ncbi:Alpha/Beta hydrolase protein [Cristinia sonorae]|uniref:acylaminoacyl-peptidase n=1 Tax=Cristinia sonorae TaxID=1940300 RepID=A0A8K0UHI5_9AGAR|nr:Alpha/Beta hydrolase protein [Cristinia sonorae]
MTNSTDIFLELASIPTYSSAQFQSKNVLRVSSRFPDFNRDTYRASTTTYVVAGDNVFSTFSPDTPEIVASTVSPSGKRLAVFREVGNSGSPKRFVEVWVNNKIEASVEVTKTHGVFYTDDIFSLISFSPKEDALVYTAEVKVDDEKEALDKYHFVPPLGEGYPGKKSPGLYYFKFNAGKPFVKPLQPSVFLKSLLLTQPTFVNDDKLLAIGYSYTNDHKLLGVKHCPNRLARVYDITLPSAVSDDSEEELLCSVAALTPEESSSRAPRVLRTNGSPSHLIYLANPVGGPHASCSTLRVIELATGKDTAAVSIVEDPKSNDFPGIYTVTLPTQPFLNIDGDPCVIFSSNWGSRTTVVLASLSQKFSPVDVTPNDDGRHLSWAVLGTDGQSQVICSRSSLNSPPELVIGNVTGVGDKVQWKIVVKPNISLELQERLSSLEIQVLATSQRFPVESIVLKDKNLQTPLPGISSIHGGPHGASLTAFSASVIARALEGYAITLPNYTGSVGYGNKYVKKLLGNIGSLEVEDCVQSIRQVIDAGITKPGREHQYLIGGSHGGFILGHLVGQHPDMFGAAAILNPVTHLGDISGTDIPDWYFEEAGIQYLPTSLMTPELYQKLFNMSPIAHVDKTRDDTPLLLVLGERDARVANAQGKQYYHALKGRGKNIRLVTFKEDNHSLDTVEAVRGVYRFVSELFEQAKAKKD